MEVDAVALVVGFQKRGLCRTKNTEGAKTGSGVQPTGLWVIWGLLKANFAVLNKAQINNPNEGPEGEEVWARCRARVVLKVFLCDRGPSVLEDATVEDGGR